MIGPGLLGGLGGHHQSAALNSFREPRHAEGGASGREQTRIETAYLRGSVVVGATPAPRIKLLP
jgi:hypothetical protein